MNISFSSVSNLHYHPGYPPLHQHRSDLLYCCPQNHYHPRFSVDDSLEIARDVVESDVWLQLEENWNITANLSQRLPLRPLLRLRLLDDADLHQGLEP